MRLWIFTLWFQFKKQRKQNKQTVKQTKFTNLNCFIWEKSCLIRSKKKNKTKQNKKTKEKNWYNNGTTKPLNVRTIMLVVIIIVIGLSTAERTIMRTADAVIEIIIITIWTRDWLGIYRKKISFIEVYKHYTESNLKQQPEEKKNQKQWDM